MQQANNSFFIITGGPGAGKTTLLDGLAKRGFKYIPEVARQLIKEQVELNGEALPWKNTELFAKSMLVRSVETYQLAHSEKNEIIFFDRGIPDSLSYARLIQLPITSEMDFAVKQFRYNKKVFILPPWFEIYKTDDERKQTWEEAVNTYKILAETYRMCDYELIKVPWDSVEKRIEFVIENAGMSEPGF